MSWDSPLFFQVDATAQLVLDTSRTEAGWEEEEGGSEDETPLCRQCTATGDSPGSGKCIEMEGRDGNDDGVDGEVGRVSSGAKGKQDGGVQVRHMQPLFDGSSDILMVPRLVNGAAEGDEEGERGKGGKGKGKGVEEREAGTARKEAGGGGVSRLSSADQAVVLGLGQLTLKSTPHDELRSE